MCHTLLEFHPMERYDYKYGKNREFGFDYFSTQRLLILKC